MENDDEKTTTEQEEEIEDELEEPSELDKEQGKWLMDLAKYLVTAFAFAVMFENIQNKLLASSIAIGLAALIYLAGIWLFGKKKKKKKKKKH
jgi:L-asparagine transporter-like permease